MIGVISHEARVEADLKIVVSEVDKTEWELGKGEVGERETVLGEELVDDESGGHKGEVDLELKEDIVDISNVCLNNFSVGE